MDILAEVARRRAAGQPTWSLCAGEPDAGAPLAVRERASALLATGEGLGYTAPLGLPELRAAVSGHYARTYGLEVAPEQVAMTTGSSGGFVLAFLAALDVGDRVAIARPGYPAYRNILQALGAQVVEVGCGPEVRYQPTPELLDAVVAEGGPLRAVIVASPANPTGTIVTANEIGALAAWCHDHGALLISDEIYHGVGTADAPTSCAWEHGQDSIVVSSFSKYWGMTGWRLGWMLLPEGLVRPVDGLAGNLALCPPSISQQAGLAAFDASAYADAEAASAGYVRHRELVMARLPELSLTTPAAPEGAFYLYADATALLARTGLPDSATLCRTLLDEAHVAVAPGTDFDTVDGGRFVRSSYAASTTDLTAALDALSAWVAAH